MTTQTLNVSAPVVKVYVRLSCSICRYYLGKPDGARPKTCKNCGTVNFIL